MLVPRDITGLVLAGGHSRRMGADKALLPWRGATMLAHSAGILDELCASTYIVSSHSRHALAGIPRVPDLYPDKGPLGGILTGFQYCPTAWVMVLACDMPLMSARLLSRLTALADDAANAVLFRQESRFQPLAGLYHRSAVPVLSAALREDRLSLQKIIPLLQVHIHPVDRNFDPQLDRALTNVNTPEEWAALQSEDV